MIPGLLAMKLHRPSTPPKRVRRPQLSQRLSAGLEAGRQVTLVSAPAGFGKTTCIAEWVEILDLPVTRLSLDRLRGDPCDAITGRTDSRFLLEQLYSANLFLIPLDDEQRWYRYHRLFAELLRDRLTTLHRDQPAGLHRRAGHWYAQASDEDGTFVSKAIEHALAAPDYALAVDLLERHAMDMLMQWHIKTVDTWMQAIPQEWT
jgi:ATP/maltotriose-dependent transcriptional regulator MalT